MPARASQRYADPLDELRSLLAAMSPEQVGQFAAGLDGDDLALVEQLVATMPHARWQPLPHQIPPDPTDVAWFVWLMLGGRGTGKTDGCAHAMDEHAKGPPCVPGVPGGHRMAIIAPTLGDASESCVNGPSGLRVHNPTVTERTMKGGTKVVWPSGAEAKLFGAYTRQDVERLRAGGNRCFVWVEELAAWRYLRACWNHMVLGLRLGAAPRVIASTTPKNRVHLRKIIAAPSTVISRGTTFDNPHLAATVRKRYEDTYGGTRLGRQELLGELLEDVEGALWHDDLLEENRVLPAGEGDGTGEAPDRYRRIIIGVDPSWGSTNDECGIVVAGIGWDNHGYVLADYSIRGGPRMWADRVAEAFWTYEADMVVAEGNFQGEQVRLAMGQVQHPQGKPLFKLVNASRGKVLRAEPIVMLYEQHRVHHVGRLTLLEHQMTTWVPAEPRDADADEDDGDEIATSRTAAGVEEPEGYDDEALPSEYSPDRIDALVFALTALMLGNEGPASVSRPKRRTTSLPDDAPETPRPPARRRATVSRPRRSTGNVTPLRPRPPR